MEMVILVRWLVILSLSLPALMTSASGPMPDASDAEPATMNLGPSRRSLPFQVGYSASPVGRTHLADCLLNRSALANVSEEWHSYPIYGGEMTSIAQDPSNPQTVYVGTRDAGVFKTTDGGQSWQPARQGLTFMPIGSLKVDPQNTDILYAGTEFHGIWKTINGGDTWSWASDGLEEGDVIMDIIIDPQDSTIVYTALAGGVGLVTGHIFKSEDAGATWTIKDNGITPYPYHPEYINGPRALAIDPATPSTLYVGTFSAGVFVSTNGGETWLPLNDGLPTTGPDSFENVNALAIDPHHSSRLTAIVDGDYYVHSGIEWQLAGLDANSSLAFLDLHIYFHPADPSILYSAGSMFAKSTDAGATWEMDYNLGSCSEIAFHPSSPDTLYAASWGVYQTVDQGQTWTEASQGITAQVIGEVAVDPQNASYIYAGDAAGNLLRSLDGGLTWEAFPVSGYHHDFWDIEVDPTNSQHLYAIEGSDLYESTNQGENFQRVNKVGSADCIAIAPNASSPIYVGTAEGIYKSVDEGLTWTQVNTGLPQCAGSGLCAIDSIAIDPNDVSTVWAGTVRGTYEEGGILKSTDGGEHWQLGGLSDKFIEAIAVQPGESSTILVGARFLDGTIFKSTDGGDSWQIKLDGIADIEEIVFDPRDPRKVYAATEGYGVLRSFDGGETWYDYTDGIFYPAVYSVAISRDDPALLVAGSYGSGLYWIYPSLANQAPNLPGNPLPANGASNVPTDQVLSWQGGDPDGDAVTYTVALGSATPPPVVASNVTMTNYNPGSLNAGTTYYWRITASDGMSETVGSLWSFSTRPNQAPNLPTNPAPADGASSVPTDQVLSWQGGDPDGDAVTYTVALGSATPPPVVVSNVTVTNYNPGSLNAGTTYYWRITASDGMSETVGPVWSFFTMQAYVTYLPLVTRDG